MIGCGRGAQVHHLPVLSRLPEVEVSAVADLNDSVLQGIGDRFGIRRRFADYRELLDLADIDAVAVATPRRAIAKSGSHPCMQASTSLWKSRLPSASTNATV
jgi:predicted dehydrogenase